MPRVDGLAGKQNGETAEDEESITVLDTIASRLVQLLNSKSLYLAAAESCTAGLVADALARIPGISSCFWGSFVCYTSQAKIQMLGVGEDTLNKYGAVSEETARAMVMGVLKKSSVDAAVSVTGLAGPEGDGSDTPVGTVWIATAVGKTTEAAKFHFSGGRNSVRQQAAKETLNQITIQLNRTGE